MSVAEQFIYSEDLYKLPPQAIVLLPVPWKDLPEAEVVLLSKILSAARLSLAGVQIVNAKETSLSKLKVFNPSLIISFGVTIAPDTGLYQAKIEGNVTIIQSDQLSALDDSRKKELWSVLKKLIVS